MSVNRAVGAEKRIMQEPRIQAALCTVFVWKILVMKHTHTNPFFSPLLHVTASNSCFQLVQTTNELLLVLNIKYDTFDFLITY